MFERVKKFSVTKRVGVLVLAWVGFTASGVVAAESFKIGFVSDGSVEASRVQALIIDELSPLIDDSAGIEFVSFTAAPSPQSFQEQVDQASADPDIKAIIAPGFLGSQLIYNQREFARPTLLSWIMDPNLIGGEVKADVPNLRWLSTRNDIESTFNTIVQVIGEKPVTLIVDAATANLGEAFFEGLKKNAQDFGLQFSITYLDRSLPTADQIPAGVALALVPPMREGSADVIAQIQASNVPVFTFDGPEAVRQGAMMTNLVDTNESLIARSIALDIYGLFQGADFESGPLWLDAEHHLTLNVASAQRMGVDLPIDALSSATVVGFTDANGDGVTLDKALRWVLDKNPDLARSRNSIELADESIIQADSALSPQLSAGLGHSRFSSGGNTVDMGSPDQNTRASIDYTHKLYSLVDRTETEIAKLNKLSQQHLNDANQQIAVVNTLSVYLQILISEASLAAQQENLRLARSNLSMAQKRVKLGSGTAGDVYNSEALIATANSDLLAARIGALEARRSLMDLTNTAFDENAVFADVGLDHPGIAASHRLVQPMLETLSGIQMLAEWSSQKAIDESPALQATSVAIESGRIQLDAADKVRYRPEVQLTGQAYRYLDSSTGSSGDSLDDVDDVSLSLNVSFPLWTSGYLTSRMRQANMQFINSELQYRAGRNTTAVDARNAAFNLAQAWQDIKLGKIALSSASKSLEINQRAYASGAITIEALQSIQTTYIAALSGDRANLYQYIQSLGNWQLQVAAVSYLMEAEAYQQWATDFKAQSPTQ